MNAIKDLASTVKTEAAFDDAKSQFEGRAESPFVSLLNIARQVSHSPVALVILQDDHNRWLEAQVGFDDSWEAPLGSAVLAHLWGVDAFAQIADMRRDLRFCSECWNVQSIPLRFLATIPIRDFEGKSVGLVCIADFTARELSPKQSQLLTDLAVVGGHLAESRKQARLHGFAQQLATLVEHSDDAIIGKSLEGTITSWNNGATAMFGYTTEEMIGRQITVLFPPGHEDEEARLMDCVRRGESVRQFETVRQRKDGQSIDIAVSLSPLRDAELNIIGVAKIARDISSKKVTERALELSEARYRALVEGQVDLVSLATPEGILTFVNDSYARHLGRPVSDILGTSLYDHVAQAERSHVRDHLLAISGSMLAEESENRTESADGILRWIAWTNRAMRDGQGRLTGIHSVGRDITARKQAQAELFQAKADLQAILDHSPVMISSWNRDHTNRFANAAYGKAYNTSPQEIKGRHVRDIIGPLAYAASAPSIERAVAGEAQTFERSLPSSDGSLRHNLVDYVPEFHNSVVTGVYVFVADVTRRVEAEMALAHNAKCFEDLYHRTPAMMHSVDAQGILISVSDMWIAKLGYRREEVLGRSAAEFLTSDSRERARTIVWQELQRTGRVQDVEYQVMCKDQRVIDILVTCVLNESGRRGSRETLVVFDDITERKALQRDLVERGELLRVTLESIGDAVITTNGDGRVQWMNPVAEHLTGWSAGAARDLLLEQVFHIVDEVTREPVENPVARYVVDQGASGLPQNTTLISKTGDEYAIEDSVAPIRDAQGQVLGLVLVFHDVTEQRRVSHEMSYRARHDPLTGLLNRGEFEFRLKQTMDLARADGSNNALLYIDLDDFKLVNDACGHEMGDQLLCQVSNLIQSCVRSRDALARVGGDEFGLILEKCSTEQAQRIAQKICDHMEEFRFIHDGRHFRVGTSIGLAPLDSRWASPAVLLQAADASCYAAKEAGRNRVHVWVDTDIAMRMRDGQTQWASRIEQALDHGKFELFAQRIQPIDGNDERLHLEILLRLREADGSIVMPGTFFPAAERFHMASRIDKYVVRKVFEWLAQADKKVTNIKTVAVNLSGQSIGDRAFHRYVRELVDLIPCDLSKLCFEITETAAITHLADATIFIQEIRKLGVRIALDDFGAGSSSFGYLKSLPVDYLKIDGQFVRDIVDDPLDLAAVRCFQDVAQVIGVKTVAEFVENEEILNILKEIGVDYVQGYLIHRPEPLGALVFHNAEVSESDTSGVHV